VSKKGVSILGSTGSIGRQTLEVIASFPGKFKVVGLSARDNMELLEEQVKKFSPHVVCVGKEEDARILVSRIGKAKTTVYFGNDQLIKLAKSNETNILVAAIPGIVGLEAVLSAIHLGKSIAIASKEILVAAGDMVMKSAKKHKSSILPLDSEHSAISQCLKGEKENKIKKIILTASGGPFLKTPLKELDGIKPSKALEHPTWKMGPKISIDSATLMNKGLEIIEAHRLFGTDYSKIGVLIHPQSIVHSMVEFEDGSVIAQMGAPDMRIPIQFALLNTERAGSKWGRLDLTKTPPLTFINPDEEKFPCLGLAYEAGKSGGTLPAVLAAADEVAVDLFLKGKIKFTDIHVLIKEVMDNHDIIKQPTLEEILKADEWAREEVSDLVSSH